MGKKMAGEEKLESGRADTEDFEESQPKASVKPVSGKKSADPKTGKTKDKEDKGVGKEEGIEILKKFSKAVLKKYGNLIRSIVLFGSTAREEWKGESDIDVFVIVDDTRNRISPALKEKIEFDLDDIAKKTHKQLSLQQPYLLTEFWRMVREGH